MSATRLTIGLNAVIVAVTEEVPRILTVERRENAEVLPALPFGPLDPEGDRTLELGLRGWVHEQTGVDLGYVEQLYTFGDRDRVPRRQGERQISVAYLALVRESETASSRGARWRDVYGFLPWEDWRHGRPEVRDRFLLPRLLAWTETGPAELRESRQRRIEICFGTGQGGWDEERVLDRYELLWEAGLVAEALRGARDETPTDLLGQSSAMALDHRRILATALGRLRGKLKYRPVVFEMMAPSFTLLQLQRVVEALAGVRLHKQNFRRLVERGGLVEGTGELEVRTGGRPAELFRFRHEVVRERPAPGLGLPAVRPARA